MPSSANNDYFRQLVANAYQDKSQANNQQAMNNYSNLYEQLVAANNRDNTQPTQMIERAPQLSGWYQDNPSAAPTRQMDYGELALSGLSQAGENLMGITGWDPEKGFTPENIGRFVASLPFQMAGGLLQAPAQLYEAGIGKNIMDRPAEDGLAYDYDLDEGQRAAQFGNFLINGPAMFAGGSARMVGTGAKFLTGGKLGKGLAAGKIGSFMKNATPKQKVAGQISFDVAEEAAEEFGQSFLDDTRWNQLNEDSVGRAAQGAAWGALGGGVMSGPAHIANYLWDKSDSNPYSQSDSDSLMAYEFEKNMNNLDGTDYTDYATKEITDRINQNQYYPASGSVTNIQRNNNYNLMQGAVGDFDLISQWNSNIEGTREELAKRFGTSVDNLGRILSIENQDARIAELKMLLASLPQKKISVILGRNPDSNVVGLGKFDIVDIFAGSGLQMNRDAAKLFGADFDGDKTQIYWLENIVDRPYLTAMLTSRITDGVNLDIDYATGMDTQPERFYAALENWFNEIRNKFAASAITDATEAFDLREEDFNKILEEARDTNNISGNKDLFKKAYQAITAARTKLIELYGDEYQADVDVADFLHKQQLSIMEVRVEQVKSIIRDAGKKKSEDFEVSEETENIIRDRLADVRDFTQAGNYPDGISDAQLAPLLAQEIWSRTPYTNVYFRQGSGNIMKPHRLNAPTLTGFMQTADQSAYDFAIAYGLGLTQFGEDSSDIINGMRIIVIQDRFSREFEGKSITENNCEEAVNLFKRIYNEETENMRKALEKDTDAGLRVIALEGIPSPLKEDEGIKSAALGRAYREVFGKFEFTDIWEIQSESGRNMFTGLSFDAVVDREYKTGNKEVPSVLSGNKNMISLWTSVMNAENSRERGVASAIENQATETASLVSQVGELFHAETNEDGSIKYVPNEETKGLLTRLVQGWQRILGAELIIDFNMASVTGFINTTWGRALLSSDQDTVLSAFVSAKLSYQERSALKLLTDPDNDLSSEETKERILIELSKNAPNSALHEYLASEYQATGFNVALAIFSNTEISFKEKQQVYDYFLKTMGLDQRSLLSDAIKDSQENFDVSKLSNSVNKAKLDFAAAQELSLLKQKALITSMKDEFGFTVIDPSKQETWYNAVKSHASETSVEIVSDIIGNVIFSHKFISAEDRAKGNVRDEVNILAQALAETLNGGNFSLIDEISATLGSVSLGRFKTNRIQLMGIIFGSLDEITIYDEYESGRETLTRDKLLGELGITATTEAEQLMALFDICPALVTWVQPQTITPNTSGARSTISVGYDNKDYIDELKERGEEIARNPQKDDGRKIVNKALMMALDNPMFYRDVVLLMDDKIADDSTTLRESCRLAKKAVERYVRRAVWEAHESKNTPDDRRYQTMRRSDSVLLLFEKVGEDIDNMAARTLLLDTSEEESNYAFLLQKAYTLKQKAVVLEDQEVLEDLGISFSEYPEYDMDLPNPLDVLKGQVERSAEDIKLLFNATFAMVGEDAMKRPDLIAASYDTYLSDLIAQAQRKVSEDTELEESKRENLQKAINRWTRVLNGDLALLFDTNIESLSSVSEDGFSTIVSDDVFTMNDFETMDGDGLANKLINIDNKYSGGLDFAMEEGKPKLAKDLKEYGDLPLDEKNNEKARKFLIQINGKITRLALNRIYREIDKKGLANEDAIPMELEAIHNFDNYVEQIRKEIPEKDWPGNRGNLFEGGTPQPVLFNASYAPKAYMAERTASNLGGGYIATGISVNGMKTKIVSALSLIRDNYFTGIDGNNYMQVTWEHGQSSPEPNETIFGRIMELLCNNVQEPMFLRLKKALEIPEHIIRKIDFGNQNTKSTGLSRGEIKPISEELKPILDKAIKDLSSYLKSSMLDAGIYKDLGFDDAHYHDLAMLMIPYFDIEIEPYTDEAGVKHGGTKQLNSHRLLTEDLGIISENENVAEIQNAWNEGRVLSVRPRIVGLDELSIKVLRAVEEEFFVSSAQQTPSSKDIYDVAESAITDWEDSGSLTVEKIFARIQPRAVSAYSPIVSSSSKSAHQKWNELHGIKLYKEIQRITKSKAIPWPTSNTNIEKEVSDFYRSHPTLLSGISESTNLQLCVASYTQLGDTGPKRAIGKLLKSSAGDSNRVLRDIKEMPSISDSGMSSGFSAVKNSADIYQGVNVVFAGDNFNREDLVSIISISNDQGRRVALNIDKAKEYGIDVQTTAFFGPDNPTINIGDEEFVIFNPSSIALKENLSIDSRELFMDRAMPKDRLRIIGGVNGYAGNSDSVTFARSGLDDGRVVKRSFTIDPRNILGGNNPITKATASDIDAINEAFNNLKRQIELGEESSDYIGIDIHSYVGKDGGMSVAAILEAIEKYINNWTKNPSQNLDSFENIAIDSCIGFIKTMRNDGEVVYAPIFYSGGDLPHVADRLTIENDRTGTQFTINYQGSRSFKNGDNKLYITDAYLKTFCSEWEGGDDTWWHISNAGIDSLDDYWSSLHYATDDHALLSRLTEVFGPRAIKNIANASSIVGGNLLFEQTNTGWELKPGITKDINIQALIDGNRREWMKLTYGGGVFSGGENASLNTTIRNIATFVLDNGGNPAWIFFPTVIKQDQNGNYYDAGQMGAVYNVMEVFKRYRNDPDLVLELFHAINPKLCYASREAYLENDDGSVFLDHLGRVWSTAQIEYLDGTTKPMGRIPTVIDEVHFLNDSTSAGSPSRQASLAFQHVCKELERTGIYPESIRKLLIQWSLATDVLDPETGIDTASLVGKGNKERVLGWLKSPQAETRPYRQRAMFAAGGVVPTTTNGTWISECNEVAAKFTKSIRVVKDDLKTTLETDPENEQDKAAVTRLNNAIERWNNALKIEDNADKYTLESLSCWIRAERGFYEQDGQGIQALTVNQIVDDIDRMVERIQKTGYPLAASTYKTKTGKTRVSLAAVTKEAMQRLYRVSSVVRAKANLEKGTMDAVDQWIKSTFENTVNDVNQNIAALKSPAQRQALRKMLDAVSLSCIGETSSGFIDYATNIYDIMEGVKDISNAWYDAYHPKYSEWYSHNVELGNNYWNTVQAAATNRLEYQSKDGRYRVFTGNNPTTAATILSQLSALRKILGTANVDMLAANMIERAANQGMQSLALMLSEANVGIFAGLKNPLTKGLTKSVSQKEDVRKFFSALRTAELAGLDKEFLYEVSKGGDLDEAINKFMKEQGLLERWAATFTDFISGKDIGISRMIQNFLDYFAIHAEKNAPWWLNTTGSGKIALEAALEQDPVRWFVDVLAGGSSHADVVFAGICFNWAKRGDVAQKNLISAIYSEIARRSRGIEFLTTTLVSPYFQYATNRLGRILQWVAPVSSIHYLLVQSSTSGILSKVPLWGTGLTLGELGLDTVQLNVNLREAMATDMIHLGPVLVAFMLVGFCGGIEPPDDEDKWGNFKEWTIFGQRIDEAWWIEDTLGLALPMAMFMRSGQLGKPRTDILVNGIAYYLNNNPVTKVSDAIAVLFDPFEELYRDYDNAVDSFARAYGGPPSIQEVMMGKLTSFGLSYFSQFITPLCLREIYNGTREYETSYKRIYEEGKTGKLTDEGAKGKTQLTSYHDAMVRKFTKDNPVMGWLADQLIHPETGYMAHEMPRTVYYDPAQMNSIEAFSLYEDPYTKQIPKSEEERLAIAYQIISVLQEKSVDELALSGFMLDSDTRNYVSEVLWDNIATLNNQYYELQQSGQLNYYQAGYGDYALGEQLVSELKQNHFNQIAYLKSLYYDKLWAPELSNLVAYNRRHTRYAQDANGDWYATGYYPSWYAPIFVAPGETEGEYQYVMSRENDWATESKVTGLSTGERGLVPIPSENGQVPNIESWSEDGTEYGYSATWNQNHGITPSSQSNSSKQPTSSISNNSTGGGYSGYRSSGGSGGGGGSSSPNIYYRAQAPNAPNATTARRTSRTKADLDYLRPNFETKGSREAYKRSDI